MKLKISLIALLALSTVGLAGGLTTIAPTDSMPDHRASATALGAGVIVAGAGGRFQASHRIDPPPNFHKAPAADFRGIPCDSPLALYARSMAEAALQRSTEPALLMITHKTWF
jgi:hypothetical protein